MVIRDHTLTSVTSIVVNTVFIVTLCPDYVGSSGVSTTNCSWGHQAQTDKQDKFVPSGTPVLGQPKWSVRLELYKLNHQLGNTPSGQSIDLLYAHNPQGMLIVVTYFRTPKS